MPEAAISSNYASKKHSFSVPEKNKCDLFPPNPTTPIEAIVDFIMDPQLIGKLERLVGEKTVQGINIGQRTLKTDNSLALFYKPNPSNDKKVVVVILHGLGHSPVHFHFLATLLAFLGITCVTVSLPGHHGSPQICSKEFSKYNLEKYGKNFHAKLAEISSLFQGYSLVTLAHSMGGPISLIDNYPIQNLKGKILLSSSGIPGAPLDFTKPLASCFLINAEKLITHGPFGYGPDMSFKTFFNGSYYPNFNPHTFKTFLASYQKEAFLAGIDLLKSAYPVALTPWRYKEGEKPLIVGMPILNLMAREDRLVPPTTGLRVGEALKKSGGLVCNRIIDRAPHNSMLTNTPELVDFIFEWLLQSKILQAQTRSN